MNELQWTKTHQNRLFGNFASNKLDGLHGSITVYTYGQCVWRVVESDDNDEYFVAVGEADSLEAAKEAVADFIHALVQFDNDCDWGEGVTPEDLRVDDLAAMVGGGQ